jgi:hypothetical protein
MSRIFSKSLPTVSSRLTDLQKGRQGRVLSGHQCGYHMSLFTWYKSRHMNQVGQHILVGDDVGDTTPKARTEWIEVSIYDCIYFFAEVHETKVKN